MERLILIEEEKIEAGVSPDGTAGRRASSITRDGRVESDHDKPYEQGGDGQSESVSALEFVVVDTTEGAPEVVAKTEAGWSAYDPLDAEPEIDWMTRMSNFHGV